MDLQMALVGGAVGLASGLITAYVAMRFRLREERAKWERDVALKYAAARAEGGAMTQSLGEQFGTYFVIVREPDQKSRKCFLMPGTRLIVGQSSSADICVAESSASRQHMAFDVRPAGVFAVDLQTANGIKVNGVPARASVKLESGDVVTIGQTNLTFVAL